MHSAFGSSSDGFVEIDENDSDDEQGEQIDLRKSMKSTNNLRNDIKMSAKTRLVGDNFHSTKKVHASNEAVI